MKKSILITLLLSTTLLAGCSKAEETSKSSSSESSVASSSSSSTSSSTESSASSSETPETTQLKMNIAEIEQGNFESLNGTWVRAMDGDSFQISDGVFINAGGSSNLSVMRGDGYNYLSTTSPGFAIVLAEAGSEFSSEKGFSGVLMPGETDQSDTTQDRIIITQNTLSGETAKEQTYYRQ